MDTAFPACPDHVDWKTLYRAPPFSRQTKALSHRRSPKRNKRFWPAAVNFSTAAEPTTSRNLWKMRYTPCVRLELLGSTPKSPKPRNCNVPSHAHPRAPYEADRR